MPTAPVPAVLDHVAVAVEAQADAWPMYAGDLAGRWIAGEPSPGFHAAQARFASGMKVEVLSPHEPEQNAFLRRYLDRNGPGPHHLTFKVPDILAALARVEEAGHRPVGVQLEYDEWKEAFLHPKDAPGIVVQLAQSANEWSTSRPADLPPPRTGEPADLVRVAHVVRDVDGTMRLFADVLGGQETGRGTDAVGDWIDVAWPGPGRVRFHAATAGTVAADWIGDRPGRLHHLRFATEHPATVAGARPDPLGLADLEVPPEANNGVRLLLDAR